MDNQTKQTRKLYYQRQKLKRAIAWRDQYQAEVDEKLAEIAKHGRVISDGTLDYPRSKVKKYNRQIAKLSALDIRTDEEKRGYHRKEYTRTKDLMFRGVPDDVVEKIERRLEREQRARERWNAKQARLIATLGTPERQAEYERRRWFLRDGLKWHSEARDILARQAIAQRHGDEIDLSQYAQEILDKYIALLADLTDLDREFADCDTAPYLRAGHARGMETREPEDHCTPV